MTNPQIVGRFTSGPRSEMSNGGSPSLMRMFCMVVFCVAAAVSSPATATFTKLVDFGANTYNGDGPFMVLVQGPDGNLYGTTSAGGLGDNGGTVFKMTPSGALTTIYSFCSQSNCADGAGPYAGLVLATNGDFYGTTQGGGAGGFGTVFEITPSGTLTTLYSFCPQGVRCTDGAYPFAVLVQATDGNFYGTTQAGGANCIPQGGCGTVFKITPSGTLTTLYSFCLQSNCADGSTPYAGLVQATNGDLYGTTEFGGANCIARGGCGTVFKITPSGTLTTIYSFCPEGGGCADGEYPFAGLVQATNGDLYGTTSNGGASGAGTVFKITLSGTLTTLYSFCSQANCTDGAGPYLAGLVQATDGNFYGTTLDGGANDNSGTVFEITPGGTLTTLYNFCSQENGQGVCTDGYYAAEGLVQDTNGEFYGSTAWGGANDEGTIFSLSVGLGAFVALQTTAGIEGATIGIFGQGFSTSSVVKFGGVQATNVRLLGSTALLATVPAGALTGAVTVTTGGTELTSNKPFHVTPQVLSFTPTSGPVGTSVTIKGTGLTQTLGVGFGDQVPAQFTVNSDTQVTATVPTGAKTGPVGVKTKGGTGISKQIFTVTP